MRILYGVCGEGRGHAGRALPVIHWLKKRHDVRVVAGEVAFEMLQKNLDNLQPTCSFRLIFRDSNVCVWRTIAYNMVRARMYALSLLRVLQLIHNFRPHVIITDFDYATNWAGWLTRTPVISLDNQMILRVCNAPKPKSAFAEFVTRVGMRIVSPGARFYVVLSFIPCRINVTNAIVVQPIVREEIQSLRCTRKGHILVYQTSPTSSEIISVLKSVPYKFSVYGMNKIGIEKNCRFEESHKQFIKDLASCDAVITNGGFTLITEAMLLGKPVLSVPIRGQYEQTMNAFLLEKNGLGVWSKKITVNSIEQFISSLPKLRENLSSAPWKNLTKWKIGMTIALKKTKKNF